MPIVSAKPYQFDIANAASHLPIPLQGPVAAAGTFISHMLGGDDPNSQVMSTMNPIEAPLVSIFKDRAARELGTQAFLDSAKSHVSSIQDAANWLASKYPRVAAHMRIDPAISEESSLGFVQPPTINNGGVTEPLTMSYTQKGITNRSPNDIKATMAHEATHVAQALGNKDMPLLYTLANQVAGYQANPFERMAEARAKSAMAGSDKMMDVFRPVLPTYSDPDMLNRTGEKNATAINLLDRLANISKTYGPLRSTANPNATEAISTILQMRRGETPDNPTIVKALQAVRNVSK